VEYDIEGKNRTINPATELLVIADYG